MKVILTENIRELGQIGDTLEVKHGYARNFLVPRGLAILATAENLKRVDELKKKKVLAVQQELEKMKKVADKLKGYKLIIEAKADEKGHLYAGISHKKIGEVLRERGIEANSDFIEISGNNIKQTGVHPVLFKYYDAEANFEVEIIKL